MISNKSCNIWLVNINYFCWIFVYHYQLEVFDNRALFNMIIMRLLFQLHCTITRNNMGKKRTNNNNLCAPLVKYTIHNHWSRFLTQSDKSVNKVMDTSCRFTFYLRTSKENYEEYEMDHGSRPGWSNELLSPQTRSPPKSPDMSQVVLILEAGNCPRERCGWKPPSLLIADRSEHSGKMLSTVFCSSVTFRWCGKTTEDYAF